MGIKIEKINTKEYRLLEDYARLSLSVGVTCKKGLVFDGASIPKSLWNKVGSPFTGNYTNAALIHDGLYKTHKTDKQTADSIFLDLMKVDKVGYFKRHTMYYAVKWFGKSSWKSYSKKQQKKNSNYVEVIKL